MKLLLLQAQVWVPSFGGGNKANRRLLEELAERGHSCTALCRAVTTRAGPQNEAELEAELKSRGAELARPNPGLYRFHYRGVDVEAMNLSGPEALQEHIARRVEELDPDWIIVSDDKRHDLLAGAQRAVSDRLLLLVQTIVQLPFGPLAANRDPQQAVRLRKARAILVISEFAKRYVARHSGLDAHLLHLPVYGPGPFRNLARFDRGYVTMINPCLEKGISIFLGLAAARPNVRFAAVPTWGADRATQVALAATPNVDVLEPVDDIEEILARTRVLLAPSLWPETFGYVVVEAMLRGIPVLASDIGGLPEAKLGTDYLLPIRPAVHRGDSFESPEQDLAPWLRALDTLLSDARLYELCSRQSHHAALEFVEPIGAFAVERLLERLREFSG